MREPLLRKLLNRMPIIRKPAIYAILLGVAFGIVAIRIFEGGQAHYGEYREVVQVVDGSELCSGVLLDQRKVLTARHCADFGAGVFPIRNSYGDLPPATLLQKHDVLDLAVLCLKYKGPSTVATMPKVDQTAQVTRFLAVGFGLYEVANPTGSWKARAGTSKVSSVLDAQFRASRELPTAPAVACHGDSGGPAYSETGRVLLGIVDQYENQGAQCGDPILYTRLDRKDVLTWLSSVGNCPSP